MGSDEIRQSRGKMLHIKKSIRKLMMRSRPGSGSNRKTNRRENRHIVRNARVQPTASSAAIQAQVAPSLGAPVSSQTIRRRLAEGHLGSRRPLLVLPLTPTHRRLFGVTPRTRKTDCSGIKPGLLQRRIQIQSQQ
ncbi:HTH_Tnp_Tc3_2 domain-containing protein [Trichonephila clavipes]|nr:HTH_Tnp_Tc3_2 domain-containing protein [Trichonephila clavipes]